ncbi:MAG: YigZ family protein [Clostridia bacterium]|nr:YigZ family protein [Clostridia bacterium]
MPQNKDKNDTYVTLKGYGADRFEEKKSLFIGEADHVENEEQAMDFIRRIGAKTPDATHHVWAYFLGGGAQARCSDDGEPQGTGGMPALEVLRKSGATDMAVVVTRYFGGTLLGAAGLVRAYSRGASLALQASGIATFVRAAELCCSLSYADHRRFVYETQRRVCRVLDTQYADTVRIRFCVPASDVPVFEDLVREWTGGRDAVSLVCERYFAFEG